MLLRCSTGLDHIELSISFLGIFLHSLKSPLKAFKMSLASIQAKTPHFLGYPSIPAHPIALVYEVPRHILRSPLHSQLLTHPTASCPLQSHTLQQEGGLETHDEPWTSSMSYEKRQSLWRHIQGLFFTHLDYFSCVNQQKWAVMGDQNEPAEACRTPN